MTETVSEWQQTGLIYVWRYHRPRHRALGWHFSGDAAGCVSLVDLMDRMAAAGEAVYRTVRLGAVTDDISRVPNFGPHKPDRFEKMKFEFQPDVGDLRLTEQEGKLVLTFGMECAPCLRAAFMDVSIGDGDFGIATSKHKKAEHWMFWWMPNINYQRGKRQ